MSSKNEWFIDVVDTKDKPWPSAVKLIEVGVPLAIARKYQIIRRYMTSGLKKRVKEARN